MPQERPPLTPAAPDKDSEKFVAFSRARWRVCKQRLEVWLARQGFRRTLSVASASVAIGALSFSIIFSVLYIHYSRVIDARVSQGPFGDSLNVYAAPLTFAVGDPLTNDALRGELRNAGYEQSPATKPGSWDVENGSIEVFPKSERTAKPITITNGSINHIERNSRSIKQCDLGTPLITMLSSGGEERRLVSFADIPPVLVHAVVSAEDKHFFQHGGLDLPRIVRAAYIDLTSGRKEQGASTLTMQLVRGLWLGPDKSWRRKLREAMMTIHLEHRWSKQQIFEAYADQVYLGRQAAYSIHGFAEGARMLFGKDLREITLPQAALLAGMVQRPSYLNPFRYPERAKERRDLVLALMRDNHYITPYQYANAVAAPVQLATNPLIEAHAPYFLDLINEELQAGQQHDETSRDVYTTLDLNLQRAAEETVASGMRNVDAIVAKSGQGSAQAEAALIAIDPHTGEIKALVGGRDYAHSQLDRVFAKRPPGSVFKPFVYAAALNTAIAGGNTIYTAATIVDDTPQTFWIGRTAYNPSNFRHEQFGSMALRDALARSDNIAAVKIAEGVGLDSVVAMARSAGFNNGIKPTPSIALGSYQVTPFEIAEAYTLFANNGFRVTPVAVVGESDQPQQALDPRVAYLMTKMLEEVTRTGTGAGIRARGFTLPAAGKTGTDHDGWFVGYTSRLLCVVWVGFDDYRELNIEGAKSALPIWGDFMKRASQLASWRDAKEFKAPNGVVSAHICTDSGKLAGDNCPNVRDEYFIAGTQPSTECDLHGTDDTQTGVNNSRPDSAIPPPGPPLH